MKDLPNTDSGLFSKEYMDKPVTEKDVIDAQKKLSETPIPNWSKVVDKCVKNAKHIVQDPVVESVDVRLTKTHVGININYKEK